MLLGLVLGKHYHTVTDGLPARCPIQQQAVCCAAVMRVRDVAHMGHSTDLKLKKPFDAELMMKYGSVSRHLAWWLVGPTHGPPLLLATLTVACR